MKKNNTKKKWKNKLHEVIYEADTFAGKLFDVVLLFIILVSVVLVMLESVTSIDDEYHDQLYIAEWVITIAFTFEYFLRIISIKKPFKYIFSFYGIIDLLSTLPMYLSIFFVGTHKLVAFRSLRLLRVFKIFKLTSYVGEADQLMKSIKASRIRISVFLFFILILCVILGTVMYIIEGPENGFISIPRSVYWSIVTLTTVGYGDIAPQTALGQFIASVIMILGYAIIAIPTGIVTSELMKGKTQTNTQSCAYCFKNDHRDGAEFCYNCGNNLHE